MIECFQIRALDAARPRNVEGPPKESDGTPKGAARKKRPADREKRREKRKTQHREVGSKPEDRWTRSERSADENRGQEDYIDRWCNPVKVQTTMQERGNSISRPKASLRSVRAEEGEANHGKPTNVEAAPKMRETVKGGAERVTCEGEPKGEAERPEQEWDVRHSHEPMVWAVGGYRGQMTRGDASFKAVVSSLLRIRTAAEPNTGVLASIYVRVLYSLRL